MKSCSRRGRVACAALIVLLVVPTLQAQEAKPAEKPAAKSPADLTRERMKRKGMHEGENWSISFELTETARGTALDFLAEAARVKPREITIFIDRTGIEDQGIDLEDPITMKMKNASLQEMLDQVSGGLLESLITDDGRVIVSAKGQAKLLADHWKSVPLLVRPTEAAKRAREALTNRGKVKGVNWSVSLRLTQTSLGNVLDFLAEAARAKPREVVIAIDTASISEAGVDLDDPIDCNVRDVSFLRALQLALPSSSGLAVVVLDDGTALVTTRDRVREMAKAGQPLLIAPTPAAAKTAKAVDLKGDDGQTMTITGAPVRASLDVIAKESGTRHEHAVAIRIDVPKDGPAGAAMERPLWFHADRWSRREVLTAILPAEVAWVIEADGSVRIAPRETLIRQAAPAAAEAMVKLARSGMVNGEDWSLSLAFTGKPLKSVLEALAEKVKKAPHRMTLTIDSHLMSEGLGDVTIDIASKGVPLEQTLARVLGTSGGFGVRRDGSILVSSRGHVAELAARGEVFLPDILTTRWVTPKNAKKHGLPSRADY